MVRSTACGPIARRSAISKPTRLGKRRRNRIGRPFKKADAGELVLLSQDEARFSMLPTRRTTLGLKGPRPVVGNRDAHDLTDVFGALNLVTGRLTTRLVERGRPQDPRVKRPSRPRHRPAACARHLRAMGRASPAERSPQVVLVIDHAPWPRGGLITKPLDQLPQLRLYRWPSDSPQLQVIERFW